MTRPATVRSRPKATRAFPDCPATAGHVFYLQGELLPTSELRRVDLASGNSESVLPGWSMGFYDVSPDASEVAFTSRRDRMESS